MNEITLFNDSISKIVSLVVNGLDSPHSKKSYKNSLNAFFTWWETAGRPPLIKATIQEYKSHLLDQNYSASTVNVKLAAIRKLASEASDNGFMPQEQANGIARVNGVKASGVRSGNWMTKKEAQALLNSPDLSTLKGIRDRAILACLLGAGLRRSELVNLTFDNVQQLESRWVLVDIVGKRNKVRTVPIASWVKVAIDAWTSAAELTEGKIFRAVWQYGYTLNANSEGITDQVIRKIVMEYTDGKFQAHDLRRTYAKLASNGGADLGQIQLNLGHASLRTTELYLGLELDLADAPSDHLGLKLK